MNVEQVRELVEGKTVKYKEWDCKVNVNKYIDNDRVAISLVDAEDGCPIADATVNIPDAVIGDNQICIPEHKYQGMIDALEKAGIAYYEGDSVAQGYVNFPIMTLGKSKATENETQRLVDCESMLDNMIHELTQDLSNFDDERTNDAEKHLRKGQSIIQDIMKEYCTECWLNERETKKSKESEKSTV
jgi:hypothetical protein